MPERDEPAAPPAFADAFACVTAPVSRLSATPALDPLALLALALALALALPLASRARFGAASATRLPSRFSPGVLTVRCAWAVPNWTAEVERGAGSVRSCVFAAASVLAAGAFSPIFKIPPDVVEGNGPLFRVSNTAYAPVPPGARCGCNVQSARAPRFRNAVPNVDRSETFSARSCCAGACLFPPSLPTRATPRRTYRVPRPMNGSRAAVTKAPDEDRAKRDVPGVPSLRRQPDRRLQRSRRPHGPLQYEFRTRAPGRGG